MLAQRENNKAKNEPASPSGVIVPSLTLIACPEASKWPNPCPFPAKPPNCCLPHPSDPQVRQSHKFSLRSQELQCASPGRSMST